MTVALTNLSDALFEESRIRLNRSALQFGVDQVYSYAIEDIRNSDFYRENTEVLSQPKGLGYWLWKPYIILESLKKVNDGDIVIYADSGIEIIASLDPLIRICALDQPLVLFANGNLINSEWTKRDCFILMDCDSKACRLALQCDAAFALFKKTKETMRFVQEWLSFCRDPRIITDVHNTLGKKNSWRFIEHRRDQSVLSLLAWKYKLTLYRMPSQYGNHYKAPAFRIPGEFNCESQKKLKQLHHYYRKPFLNSPYGQLLDQHRSKKYIIPVQFQPFLKKLGRRIREWI